MPRRAPRSSARGSGRALATALARIAGCASIAASCADRAAAVRFVDGTEAARIEFERDSGRTEDFFYVEFMTGGVTLFDAEGDGDLDLYFLNGRRLSGPPQDPPPRNAFYENDGGGRFSERTGPSGLGDERFSSGVCGADYDNDGDHDLYLTNFAGANALYQNDGSGRFDDRAEAAGVTGAEWFDSACAFADVDRDGWLDLYVGNCLDHTPENNKVCVWPKRDKSGPARRYCNPDNYNPVPDLLFRNRGDGTFVDVSEESGIASSKGRTLGVAFGDYDTDGDCDIFVACDRTANLYYENDGRGRFREIGLQTGAILSRDGKAQAGMGIASGDFTGDLRLDVVVSYFELERNGFYENQGGHAFRDLSLGNGTGGPSRPLLGWGVELFDADLDTDLDVLLVNGHIIDNVHLFREPVAPYPQPNLFFLNEGDGTFDHLGTRAGPALEIEKVSRGLAVGDVDGDGDLDAVVANLHGRPDLLRNDSPRAGHHWLVVRPVGTVSNRDAIGARLVAHLPDRKLLRDVQTGQSYLSQSSLDVHFGLGPHERLPLLEVRWPSGSVSRLEDVAADQVLEIVEPASGG